MVVAVWLLLPIIALLLAPRHAPVRSSDPAAIVSVVAQTSPIQASPEFYPWVRTSPPLPLPEGLSPWTEAPKPRSGGFVTYLNSPLNDAVFNASNHSNGDPSSFYGADWVPENIMARDGGAFLEVKRQLRSGLPYTAAEMQSGETYGYGRYEAVMQPARGSGIVSAFFIYTGPWFGKPHDEIDIEFVGSDTTKVHFNYFRNGQRVKPASFDLPFDAAARPHLYAFDWRPDGITWYVDGEPVYATETGDTQIPVNGGKVMLSAWTGKQSMEAWHGPPLFRDGSGAHFNCVSFTPLGHETLKCSDAYVSPSATTRAASR